MKNYKLILISSLGLFLMIQGCKKDSTKAVSNANVAGNWSGRYTFSPSTTYTTMAKFILDAIGNATVTDSVDGQALTGTYTISGDSLITTVSNPSYGVSFRFKVTNNITRMDGKWVHSSGAPFGLIYQDKY